MTMINLKNIANYVWPREKNFYSEVKGASRGVVTFWNPDVGNENLIYSSKF